MWGPLKIDTNRWSQQTTWPLSAKEWKKLWKTWWFHCCYLAKRKWQMILWVVLDFSSMFGSGVSIIDKNIVQFFSSSCVRAMTILWWRNISFWQAMPLHQCLLACLILLLLLRQYCHCFINIGLYSKVNVSAMVLSANIAFKMHEYLTCDINGVFRVMHPGMKSPWPWAFIFSQCFNLTFNILHTRSLFHNNCHIKVVIQWQGWT